MQDEIVSATKALNLQHVAIKAGAEYAWVIVCDQSDYPRKFVARLSASPPSAHVMVADTLAGIRAMLPPEMELSERRPADPRGVVEIWFSRSA